MVERNQLLAWCDSTLQTHLFKDYAPNGLQIEGKTQINKIVAAVTASGAAIQAAISHHADLLLVHHGMFWKSEPVTIAGWKKQRIAALLQHDINMVGYHLPLDAHIELGNNAQLAKHLGWQFEYACGEQNLLNIGSLPVAQSLQQLADDIECKLSRQPTVIGDLNRTIKKIAWCTGGAQGFFQTALDMNVDVYITGEISEAQFHLANETGVAFISAGHHATERYGILALTDALQQQFGVEIFFFDEENPA